MPRTPRRFRAGFTLIEILIALVVLLVGIVGILALFPVGIESTRTAVQDSHAAILAESIHHAIVIGMREASGTDVTLVHDGCPNDPMRYTFTLPTAPAVEHHPSSAITGYAGPGAPRIFQLGRRTGDGQAEAAVEDPLADIRGAESTAPADASTGSDATIDYAQYYWDFYISQMTDASGGTLPLYQFRIRIWRNYADAGAVETWTLPDTGTAPPSLIQEFRVLVAANS